MAETIEEKQEEKAPDILALVKEYIATRLELTRLTAIERIAVTVSSIVTDTVMLLAALLAFLFASFTLAFWIGEEIGSYAAGFGIVTLIYLAIALIVFFIKDKLNAFLNDFLVKRIFKRNK